MCIRLLYVYMVFAGLRVFQVSIEPSQGVLPPSSSCSVNVLFRAMCCESFESVLQLAVLNGTGW